MKIARKREVKYEYQKYYITISIVSDSYFLEIGDPDKNELTKFYRWYETENEAVLNAQEIIERDMLEKADKRILSDAIEESLIKWRRIYEVSEDLDYGFTVEDTLNRIDDPCGFCIQFQTCSWCPARQKCDEMQAKSHKLWESYDYCCENKDHKACLSQEEWELALTDIAEDVINYLTQLKDTYILEGEKKDV